MDDMKKRLIIETPCTEGEADMRIRRAIVMATTTPHRLLTFYHLERQMCLRGIAITGDTVKSFHEDSFHLLIASMVPNA